METKSTASCSHKVADDDQSVRSIRMTLHFEGRKDAMRMIFARFFAAAEGQQTARPFSAVKAPRFVFCVSAQDL